MKEVQEKVRVWVLQVLGAETCKNKTERTNRFLEEAIELAQSAGCSKQDAIALVEYVYNKEPGEAYQEVGDVLITLAAFCTAFKLDMAACGSLKLNDNWTDSEKIRAKFLNRPEQGPLPV